MKMLEGMVTDKDGREVQAYVVQCSDCDGLSFMLIDIGPERAAHLQCTSCNTTYCRAGCCSPGPSPYAEA